MSNDVKQYQERIITRLHDDEARLVEHQVALCPLIEGAVAAVESLDFAQVKRCADSLKEWLKDSHNRRDCLASTVQMLYYFAVLGDKDKADNAG